MDDLLLLIFDISLNALWKSELSPFILLDCSPLVNLNTNETE